MLLTSTADKKPERANTGVGYTRPGRGQLNPTPAAPSQRRQPGEERGRSKIGAAGEGASLCESCRRAPRPQRPPPASLLGGEKESSSPDPTGRRTAAAGQLGSGNPAPSPSLLQGPLPPRKMAVASAGRVPPLSNPRARPAPGRTVADLDVVNIAIGTGKKREERERWLICGSCSGKSVLYAKPTERSGTPSLTSAIGRLIECGSTSYGPAQQDRSGCHFLSASGFGRGPRSYRHGDLADWRLYLRREAWKPGAHDPLANQPWGATNRLLHGTVSAFFPSPGTRRPPPWLSCTMWRPIWANCARPQIHGTQFHAPGNGCPSRPPRPAMGQKCGCGSWDAVPPPSGSPQRRARVGLAQSAPQRACGGAGVAGRGLYALHAGGDALRPGAVAWSGPAQGLPQHHQQQSWTSKQSICHVWVDCGPECCLCGCNAKN
eukprot:scaffold2886_cov398-Prasinococcus_capsulatus_cf.AAC.7